MITAIVKAFVLPNKKEELRRIATILQNEYAPDEEGCLQYESYIDSLTFITLEQWRDQASLDKHLAQDHVKKYVPLMRECIEGKFFDVLFIKGGEIERVKI